MIRTQRALPLACRLALLIACLVIPASAARAAETTVSYIHESISAYEKQLAAGEIQHATFNKRVRNVHLELKNGEKYLVHYPPKDEPHISSQLHAKGVAVTILSPSAAKSEAAKKGPVHHKLRYIVGGIVVGIAVIVAIVLLVDRRRKRLAE
jgi:hypothetical protein